MAPWGMFLQAPCLLLSAQMLGSGIGCLASTTKAVGTREER